MDEWIKIVGLTLMAGLAMPLGAILARFERIGPNWLEEEFRHLVIAFGGGALLSAVALVLVPEGSEDLPKWTVALSFGGGGLSFMLLDRWLAGFQTHASQLSAMLSDFIPEALALGAAFAFNPNTAVLLAGLKVGATLAVIGALVGEFVQPKSQGLGFLLEPFVISLRQIL